MKFKGKRILVIGAGVSGLASVDFFVKRGAEVVVYDDDRMPRFETTVDNGARYEFEVENLHEKDFDLAVLSPGISVNHPLAVKFHTKLTNDLIVGLSCKTRKVIAVTGTNGKTTVVNLINDAINSQRGLFKRKSVLCGNSGVPVTKVQNELKKKIATVEVSSFMLEPVVLSGEIVQKHKLIFRPNIAVILNVTQDHLERHGSMENYIRHKQILTINQKKRDILILNYDDETVRQMASHTKARVLYFSKEARVRGVYVDGDNVFLNIGKQAQKIASLGRLGITSPHDILNFLAMALVVKLLGCSDSVLRAVKRIDNHRIEYVDSVGEIAFYNDSKATNIAACLAACAGFALPICLLVGGQAKNQDFKVLFEKLPENVMHVFTYGEAGRCIRKDAAAVGFRRVTRYETIDEAFEAAKGYGDHAKVVLLSPACASFDQFRGYADRGDYFKKLVKNAKI